jgi:hypothetical protein
MKTKIQTAIKVVETFGLFELARLTVRKLAAVKSETGRSSSPQGVKIKTQKELTNEYYSLVLSASLTEIASARQKYQKYRADFEKKMSSPRNSFFGPIFDLGSGLSEFVFLYILIKKPQVVIETGVAAGVSTNSILTALDLNGSGLLVSLDITDKVGELIDENLKSKWKLEVLPELARENAYTNFLRENNQARLFLHDSDHSGSWQIKEFSIAVQCLTNLELFLFDDISQELIDFISQNYPDFQILVVDENRKYSAIIIREFA